MKITVIGAGGVGGYIGAKLALAGQDVTFVVRGKNYQQIKSNGLKVKSILGDFHVKALSLVENISEIKETELVIICVKAWQVKNVANELKKYINKDFLILPLQNGLLISEELLSVFDSEQILGGLCRIISRLEEPGVVIHSGINPEIIFGELNNVVSERALKLQDLFKKAEISSIIAVDIQVEIWRKFIETCVSGLLVVTDKSLGAVLEMNESREMMYNMLQEIYVVSQAAGIPLEENSIDNMMSLFQSFPYDTTFSLTRDVREGRPSEIEYQCGLVVRLGRELGIPTPINTYIYKSILPLEMIARKQLEKS